MKLTIRERLTSIGFPIEQFGAHYGVLADDVRFRVDHHPEYLGSWLVSATVKSDSAIFKDFETEHVLWRRYRVEGGEVPDMITVIWEARYL